MKRKKYSEKNFEGIQGNLKLKILFHKPRKHLGQKNKMKVIFAEVHEFVKNAKNNL